MESCSNSTKDMTFPSQINEQTSASSNTTSTRKEKQSKRGITIMKDVARCKKWGISLPVGWNDKGQPIDPNKSKFVCYIGVVTRAHVPITISNWADVPKNVKKSIWDDVHQAFDIDESREKFVLQEAGLLARSFRTKMAKLVKDREGNPNYNVPEKYIDRISKEDWVEFVNNCFDDQFRKLSQENKIRASNHVYPYKRSSIGYALLEQRLLAERKEEGDDQMQVSRHILWREARVNKEGVIDNENVRRVAKQCEALSQSQATDEKVVGRDDILAKALNLPEHPGRVRGVGFGVSQRDILIPQKKQKQVDPLLLAMQERVEVMQKAIVSLKKQKPTGMEMEAPVEVEQPNTKGSCASHHPQQLSQQASSTASSPF